MPAPYHFTFVTKLFLLRLLGSGLRLLRLVLSGDGVILGFGNHLAVAVEC